MYAHFLLPQLLFLYLVDCKWSAYSTWSDCSVSCGEGTKFATRRIVQNAINGGNECIGKSKQVTPCNLGACPGRKLKFLI